MDLTQARFGRASALTGEIVVRREVPLVKMRQSVAQLIADELASASVADDPADADHPDLGHVDDRRGTVRAQRAVVVQREALR